MIITKLIAFRVFDETNVVRSLLENLRITGNWITEYTSYVILYLGGNNNRGDHFVCQVVQLKCQVWICNLNCRDCCYSICFVECLNSLSNTQNAYNEKNVIYLYNKQHFTQKAVEFCREVLVYSTSTRHIICIRIFHVVYCCNKGTMQRIYIQ